MDTLNNKLGVNYAMEQIKKGKALDLDLIEKGAIEKLKSNELKVLKPSLRKIPNGYYSK